MKNIIFNTIKYLLFFAIGVFIFWLLYREIEWQELVTALKGLKYQWLALSLFFGLLSHFSRAIRWKMLIKPLGYNPSLWNTYLSVLVLYFVNLVLPRAGEVARCTVISRTDKVPFTKLVGTVFIERLADMIMLFVLAIIIIASNLQVVGRIFSQNPELSENLLKILSPKYLVFIFLGLFLVVLILYLVRKHLRKSSKKNKLSELKNQFIDGIKSIVHMKTKWLFFGHTVFIFLMWLCMLYVVFLAFEPTEQLTVRIGTVVFLMGGLAMLAPVQGGIGPWHFMVIITLQAYDIGYSDASIFALVAHTSTNLIYILFGGLALLILILKYGKAVRLRPLEQTDEIK